MSEILQRAKTHFRDRLSADMEYVSCPEWGEEDKPLKIYYKPSTLEQRNRIYSYLKDGNLKFIAQTLIERALKEDESPMFRKVHMTELMKSVDPDVIQYIVAEMAAGEDDEMDAEKNS